MIQSVHDVQGKQLKIGNHLKKRNQNIISRIRYIIKVAFKDVILNQNMIYTSRIFLMFFYGSTVGIENMMSV